MDATEVGEYLEFLSKNVYELKQLGKDWGMNDVEISSCIKRALKETPRKSAVPTVKIKGRKIWSFIRHALKIWFCTVVVITAIFSTTWYVISTSENTNSYVGKVLQPYGYTIFRTIRLLALPVHDAMGWSEQVLHDTECLVGNPYYKDPPLDCQYCVDLGKNGIHIMKELNQTLMTSLWDKHTPVCLRGGNLRNMTFKDLRKFFLDSRDQLIGDHIIQSTKPEIRTLWDLFDNDQMEDEILKTKGLVLEWKTQVCRTSSIIRRLFPRLPFIPSYAEIGMGKHLYIDGPMSEQYDPGEGVLSMSFYIQASGKRKAVLVPGRNCPKRCEIMTVIMGGGDVLIYEAVKWKLYLLPNLKNISVGFSGSFSYDFPNEIPIESFLNPEEILEPNEDGGIQESKPMVKDSNPVSDVESKGEHDLKEEKN